MKKFPTGRLHAAIRWWHQHRLWMTSYRIPIFLYFLNGWLIGVRIKICSAEPWIPVSFSPSWPGQLFHLPFSFSSCPRFSWKGNFRPARTHTLLIGTWHAKFHHTFADVRDTQAQSTSDASVAAHMNTRMLHVYQEGWCCRAQKSQVILCWVMQVRKAAPTALRPRVQLRFNAAIRSMQMGVFEDVKINLQINAEKGCK